MPNTLRRRAPAIALLGAVLASCGGAAEARAAGLAVDKLVTTNQSAKAATIVSPAFTTAAPNELLVAFASSDGPMAPGSQSFSGVTGGGLTWTLRRRANAQAGTSEIWQAAAPAVLTNAKVTATRFSGSYQGSLTVVAFTGADTAATGATAAAGAATGAPRVALTTSRAGAWVWGAGSDWDKAVARTVGAGQTKVSEYLAPAGDTFWLQRRTDPTAAGGTAVTLDDTAPTTDRWNLAALEVLPAGTDTQPPTAPTALAAGTVLANRVNLSWTAATDDFGVAGYRVYRDGNEVGNPAGTSFADTTVSPGATYTYTVKAYDGVGQTSGASNAVTVTTPAPDTTAPTVSLTAPAAGAALSGTATVTADANDGVGVAGVQFLLDGASLGAEDSAAPYSVAWDTVAAANGPHSLSARVRDAAGNTGTAATVNVTVSNAGTGTDPAQVGQWGAPIPFPAIAIHSALNPDGKILLFQGDFNHAGDQYVFDPQNGSVTRLPDAASNLFCAAQAVLADGRVQVAGGTASSGGLGLMDSNAFNWKTSTWSSLAPMHYRRWYPTTTTLGDGRILATSGSDKSLTDLVEIPEVYSPAGNAWTELAAARHRVPYYPFMYQLPNGKVAWLGASEEATPSEVLDLNTNQWATLDNRLIDGGSIANYAPGKFLKAGTSSDGGFTGQSAATAYTLDLSSGAGTWQSTAPMGFGRSFLNLTNLPDGKVLATGGGTDRSSQIDANGVRPAESWDPGTGQWTKYASMAEARLYHSVAVLLPDGRVYVAGGGSDAGVTDHKTAQIFSPPYLFKGARPTISSAPATVRYGTNAFVGTPDAGSISRVSLIRTGSVTHAFDQNARAMALQFTQTVGGIDVKMPPDGNTAPPGYYMLFLVNAQGVPSVASLVRFPAPYEDDVAPGAPSNLAGTGQLGAASLTWTAATDDVGVARYDVHRSRTAGFTPAAANKAGESTTTSFTDSGLAPGDYYYRVTAEDAAGNVGPATAEVKVTVGADGSPPTAPSGLTATPGSRSVALAWTAATDDAGVSGYRVFRDGSEVATTAGTSYTDTGLTPATTYTYTVAAYDAAGNNGPASAPASASPTAAAAVPALDKAVFTHQGANGASLVSPAISTSQPGGLLVAFLASDGPSGAASQAFTSVTGGGLAWKLRQRTNAQAGAAEIWQATAPGVLTNAVVTATRGGGSYQGAMTVAAFTGADGATLGAVGSGSAATGAPTASLTTTRAASWVWGVGVDWDNAVSRTAGAGQTLVDQYFSPSGDSYWTQSRAAVAGAAGTPVTINDTAPTTDRWNLSLVEILAGS